MQTRKQADAILVFFRENIANFSFFLNEENNEALNKFEHDKNITLVYLKSTNPHDAKRSTYGYIKNILPALKKEKKFF